MLEVVILIKLKLKAKSQKELWIILEENRVNKLKMFKKLLINFNTFIIYSHFSTFFQFLIKNRMFLILFNVQKFENRFKCFFVLFLKFIDFLSKHVRRDFIFSFLIVNLKMFRVKRWEISNRAICACEILVCHIILRFELFSYFCKIV